MEWWRNQINMDAQSQKWNPGDRVVCCATVPGTSQLVVGDSYTVKEEHSLHVIVYGGDVKRQWDKRLFRLESEIYPNYIPKDKDFKFISTLTITKEEVTI